MNQVYRCYAEKRPGFDQEARHLLTELREQLGLPLTALRILHRYDVDQIDAGVYERSRQVVFSEPMVDDFYDEALPVFEGSHSLLAVEALPGQFDQRSDSCAQCVQLLAGVERPLVSAATLYVFFPALSEADMERVKSYLINPVERREAAMDKPATLVQQYAVPTEVPTVTGFTGMDEDALKKLLETMGLAMDLDDLTFLQRYFRDEERRDPTVTEIKVVDTYWSDHCRHTTFSTHIDAAELSDAGVRDAYEQYLREKEEVYGPEKAAKRPTTLMDIATQGTKLIKKRGGVQNIDQSGEINACSIHIPVDVDGSEEDWLLQFKNETHNHPTEIEPFGGAATCIGGAIRDPLSGRAYIYQAMRITGCADPRTPMSETIPGRLPQRKLATTAAAGYSSYGNQIGLATGVVTEFYHPGYAAKHMELGAVVGAVRSDAVVRETPEAGDVVILLGGRTGRDGIGGATGSSKSHNLDSLQTMGSEVQKGNAPEERKLQRLFRNGDVTRMIRRCNDFGAGGVSVAIGELADGLDIDLNAVRKKYEGLDGTELAISESQERMAVVVRANDAEKFIEAATSENLEAYIVAKVTEEPRMVLRWNGRTIASLSRAFLNSNGAEKHTAVKVPALPGKPEQWQGADVREHLFALAQNPNTASQRGLGERFDASIGAGSVLFPYGGKHQLTPAQSMVGLIPVGPGKQTETCSIMAAGFDPNLMSRNPYLGAQCSVVESVAKVVAAGGEQKDIYLTLQEYFERLRTEPERWGKPFSALLGAYRAQTALGNAAIGGKDSMSGSFMDLDVPPTLVSFAIAPGKVDNIVSAEFKGENHPVYLFEADSTDYEGLKALWAKYHELVLAGKVKAAWAVSLGGVAEGLMKMSFGNGIGFSECEKLDNETLFGQKYGSIVAELTEDADFGRKLGVTTSAPSFTVGGVTIALDELRSAWEGTLENVYPTRAAAEQADIPAVDCAQRTTHAPASKIARPRAVIPVFPGTNCEYDTANACLRAGIEPEIVVVRNLSRELLEDSARELETAIRGAEMIVLPGGFSGGDEPEGSGKFIASFFRGERLKNAVHDLLRNRDGLMLGICNGFQALVKLGLVPFGEIRELDETCPTLTFNQIGRHQSRYCDIRVASVHSPWMLKANVGEVYSVPISHGEGRFVAPQSVLETLRANGQIATQYVDANGMPSLDIAANPNASLWAIEGIFSPDGRVFGKMGHSERWNPGVALNIPGEKLMPVFESGAAYFK